MALSFVGSLLMLSSNLAGGGLHFALGAADLLGIGLALASAVFLALYMLAVRRTMTTRVSALGVLLFQSMVICTVSLTLSLALGEDWSRWLSLQPGDWAIFIVFAVLILSGANALQIVALRRLGAPVVSSLMDWRLVSTLLGRDLAAGRGAARLGAPAGHGDCAGHGNVVRAQGGGSKGLKQCDRTWSNRAYAFGGESAAGACVIMPTAPAG